jgi:hypothetical protein
MFSEELSMCHLGQVGRVGSSFRLQTAHARELVVARHTHRVSAKKNKNSWRSQARHQLPSLCWNTLKV